MHPVIIDADTGNQLWRAADCANHCGIAQRTWLSYTSRQQAPAPTGRLDQRTPLWDADEVRTWHANRPGSPIPNHPTGNRP